MAGSWMRTNARGLDDLSGSLNSMRKDLAKARRMAMKDALKSTAGRGKKLVRQLYDIRLKDQKRLDTSIRQKTEASYERGELEFSGGVGDPLRYFPASPRRGPQNWKGINPRNRKPKGGTLFRVKKGGRWKTRRGPKGESTFWFRGATHGKYLIGYREKDTGKISTWGLFGPSSIQAIGRDDNYSVLSGWLLERYEKRFQHYQTAFLRGILR